MPNSIFISYRRADSSDVTGRIYERLADHFGREAVFRDVHSIPYGVDFRTHLTQQLGRCQVMVAVIGSTWLSVSDAEGRRRLENPDDWVRAEIETALGREIPVIPLLVGGARLPKANELPEILRDLAYRTAAPARPDPDFHQDMRRLIRRIEEIVGEPEERSGNPLISPPQEEVNQERDQLDQEQTLINILSDILQDHESQFRAMHAAFMQTVKNRKYKTPRNPQTSQEIVIELLRAPQGQFPYSALEQFVACLVFSTENLILMRKLRSCGEQQVNNWNELLECVRNHQEQQTQNAQPVIMVLIEYSHEASIQEQNSDCYRLKAWLIQDMNQYIEQQQGYSSIELSGAIKGETYLLNDLVKEAHPLITEFLTKGSQELVNDPEIHIFLPLKLMNQEVDRWLLNDPWGRPKLLGHDYKVVLRFADRASGSYRQRPRWRRKWEQHQSSLQRVAFEMFTSGNDNDLDELSSVLDELEDNVVGLQLTQAPSQVERDDVFGVLLQSALPLAIWGRRSLLNSTNKAELDRILQDCRLEQLPDTVKQERCQARNQEEGCHIGYHLSLLWDNPYLLPPKPDY